MRIPELQGLQPLDYHNRLLAIWSEVEVVGVGNRDEAAWLAAVGVDDGKGASGFVVDVEGLHVPGGGDVVGDLTNWVVIYDLEGFGVYNVHGAVPDVGDVDPLWDVGQLFADLR